ncbi:hypothetical protein FOPE_02349 [Fonsecaea pedrosoi]|nr:hypothetical protein FOPE_02349 [Fonsecaea pedrosoi]
MSAYVKGSPLGYPVPGDDSVLKREALSVTSRILRLLRLLYPATGLGPSRVHVNLQAGCRELQVLIERAVAVAGGGAAVPANQVDWLKSQAQGLEVKFQKANRACKVGSNNGLSKLGEVWQLPDPPKDTFHSLKMPFQQKEFSQPPHPPVGTPENSETAKPWYNVAPGIWELHLNGEKNSEQRAVLQWWEPNAVSATDEAITHTYIEEVCIVQGELEDVTLGQAWSTGAYAYRNPGMEHGPYKASASGCLMFVKVLPGSKPGYSHD